MKKRLLALALCLVMMTSLLPITAAATDYQLKSASITSKGWLVGDLPFIGNNVYQLNITDWALVCDGATIKKGDNNNFQTFSLITREKTLYRPLTTQPEPGVPYYVCIEIYNSVEAADHSYPITDQFGANLTITLVEGFTATFDSAIKLYNSIGNNYGIRIWFRLIKEEVHEHNWQFTVSESRDILTATCLNEGCDIGTVSVTLSAHTVTLPDGSPFNAQLAGKEQFETATGAAISKIRYDYKGSDGVWHKGVDPVAANAKAGEYQAFVQVSNLPGTVVGESGNILNQNGEGYLYVKYTAVDPKVTAQTGDNRPIELMMGIVVVFSALAAAAFVLDSKRKYSR